MQILCKISMIELNINGEKRFDKPESLADLVHHNKNKILFFVGGIAAAAAMCIAFNQDYKNGYESSEFRHRINKRMDNAFQDKYKDATYFFPDENRPYPANSDIFKEAFMEGKTEAANPYIKLILKEIEQEGSKVRQKLEGEDRYTFDF